MEPTFFSMLKPLRAEHDLRLMPEKSAEPLENKAGTSTVQDTALECVKTLYECMTSAPRDQSLILLVISFLILKKKIQQSLHFQDDQRKYKEAG